LHDLGNLVKFDMTLFPDLFEPEWIAYRTQQKQSTIQNHGFPAEPATLSMCTQLPLTQTTQKLLESFLSSRFEKAIEDQLPIQILLVHFADMHIWMSWYIPRKERVQKLRKRYIRNKNYSEQQADDITQEILQTWQHTYELLYSLWRDGSSLDPEYIDQQAALLRSFQII
jgi:hypothetical protein